MDEDAEEYNMDDAAGDSPSEGSSADLGTEDSQEEAGDEVEGTSSLSDVGEEDDYVASTPAVKVSAPSPSSQSQGRTRSQSPSSLGRPPPWTDYQAAVAERQWKATTSRQFAKAPVIDPILTIPHGSSVNALYVPPCGTHLFSGGADGFIRRIAIHESVTSSNAENLTMKQGGHPTLAEREGEAEPRPFLVGYWENEDDIPPTLLPRPDMRMRWGPKGVGNATRVSPVYSLVVHSQELWGLSGTELGNINLFTIRHDEGQIRHVLRSLPPDSADPSTRGHRHGSAVSSLTLDDHETKLLSGAWDGSILEWDLNTGQAIADFGGHTAQISSVFYRAPSAASLFESKSPAQQEDEDKQEDGVDDRGDVGGIANGKLAAANGIQQMEVDEAKDGGEAKVEPNSPEAGDGYDPLFDGADGSGSDAAGSPDDTYGQTPAAQTAQDSKPPRIDEFTSTSANANGVLKPTMTAMNLPPATEASLPPMSNDLILASAIDGQVLLWDRRCRSSGSEAGFVRRLPLPKGTSPWAASAAWSTDGSAVFVGRRNHSVDEYDLRYIQQSRMGAVQRTIRLPPSSGAVSCVVAWPDGKHLACASFDNVRLWNLQAEADKVKIPFRIIPGNSSGFVSQMCVTPSQRYFITASGDRGWDALNNEAVVIHEIRAA